MHGSIMALAPIRDVRGAQEGHSPRIHSGNLTGGWQQRLQPPQYPPGIHKSHFPLPMFFPCWEYTCQVGRAPVTFLPNSKPTDLFGSPLDPGIWQYCGLKVEERFSTACGTWFTVDVFPYLCVPVSNIQVRHLVKEKKKRVTLSGSEQSSDCEREAAE